MVVLKRKLFLLILKCLNLPRQDFLLDISMGDCYKSLDNLLQSRKQATQIVTNLQGQKLQSRLIACEYMERNLALVDILIAG